MGGFSCRANSSIDGFDAMRKSFDQSVPLHEQIARGSKTVSTGRKHQHRLGPGKKAEKVAKAAGHLTARLAKRRKRVAAMVHDYFTGKRDTHP